MAVPTPPPQEPHPHPDSHPDPIQATTPAHPTSVDHPESPADPTNITSRIMFFVMLALIIGSIAIFLILHPRPNG